MRSAIKGTKVQIIYQLANLPISRFFFSSHSPYTNDIGTIQEERTISDPLPKYKHLLFPFLPAFPQSPVRLALPPVSPVPLVPPVPAFPQSPVRLALPALIIGINFVLLLSKKNVL